MSRANALVQQQINPQLSFDAANDDEETSLWRSDRLHDAVLIVPDPRATLTFKRMDDVSGFVIHEGPDQLQSRATTVARFDGPAGHLAHLLGFKQFHPYPPAGQRIITQRYPEIRRLPN
jgi:hypothetical protein